MTQLSQVEIDKAVELGKTIKPDKMDSIIEANLAEAFSQSDLFTLVQTFMRDGFIKVSEIVPIDVRGAVREEAIRLLDAYAERRDLRLGTTDYTPRKMSVVHSEYIAENSEYIRSIYESQALRGFLRALAGEEFITCPSEDELFLITRQEKPGDTHGWHWGDFTYALIWLLEAPPIEYGGMLQCVPHTSWNKADAQINRYLVENPIRTYDFVTGDIYLLKTDTTLHRTIPLEKETLRIILNMTWAAPKDMKKQGKESDRWWSETQVKAGSYE
jgi:hypothetical protein